MPRPIAVLLSATLSVAGMARTLQAQSGGFVATLGRDTVHVEQFRRTGQRLEGVVAYRSPIARIVRYHAQIGADGWIVRYQQQLFKPDGTRIEPNSANASLTFSHDSVTRETVRGTEPVTQRLATPNGATPLLGSSLMIPFAYSYLTYELAYARARAKQPTGETVWHLLSTSAGQSAPQALRVWHIVPDSAEGDYFGVARSAFKFDSEGRLLRSDWTGTTYQYKVVRVAQADPEAQARVWAAQEAAGTGMGSYSPRDTTRATLAGANLWIDYSRPARRERQIWGGVVPWNRIWRLGADMATQFRTDTEILIGEAVIPAGIYSLWLQPTESEAMLVINQQSGQFGTQYDPRQDLVRVPMRRIALRDQVERLTLSIRENELRVAWGDAAYSLSLRKR